MRIAIRTEFITAILAVGAITTLASMPLTLTSWQLYALIANVVLLCLHHYALGYYRGGRVVHEAATEAFKEVLQKATEMRAAVERDITTGQENERPLH